MNEQQSRPIGSRAGLVRFLADFLTGEGQNRTPVTVESLGGDAVTGASALDSSLGEPRRVEDTIHERKRKPRRGQRRGNNRDGAAGRGPG